MTTARRNALAALLLLPALPARTDPPPWAGQGRGRGGPPGQQGIPPGQGGVPPGQARRFAGSEAAMIRSWQAANPYWVPQPLPPGQMRRLARGKPLPPGIARQALPPPLLAQLPVYPGYSYAMIGTTLVLLSAAGIVVDMLGGLF